MAHWPGLTATRFARSQSQDGLVSSMTSVSVVGLVLGVAVLVIVLSVMNGFERELRERVLGVLAHGIISSDEGLADWQETARQIETHPEITGVAPIEEGSGLIVSGGKIAGVQFAGIYPAEEVKVSLIPDHMVAGSLDLLVPGKFKIIVGADLSDNLNLQPGDRLTLVLPDARMTMAGPQPRMRRFEVVGVFEVGSDADKNQVYFHLDDALALHRKRQVSSLRLSVTDLFEAPRVMREVALSIPNKDWYGSSWLRRNGNLYDAIQTQKTTLFLLLLMLVAVAAFNIISNLILIVNDRKSDIAILRTMGASTRDIARIFIYQGMFIGGSGIVVGLLLGSVIANYITSAYRSVDNLLSLGLMNEYFIDYLPSQILFTDLAMIASVSLLISLVATIYPALVASRTRPAEALRYE